MFTGIVSDRGEVSSVSSGGGGARFEILTGYDTLSLGVGDSIACNGCCLTAIDVGPDSFSVDVSNETLSRTTLGHWSTGSSVNLERALKLGDELGGHLVSGHVDCVAEVTSTQKDGDSTRFTFKMPADISRFISEKGSVAIDGVSLTVNEVADETFGVNVIPHTLSVTTLGALREGDAVNIEIDMLARYVARLLSGAKG